MNILGGLFSQEKGFLAKRKKWLHASMPIVTMKSGTAHECNRGFSALLPKESHISPPAPPRDKKEKKIRADGLIKATTLERADSKAGWSLHCLDDLSLP